jgi:hypothetical protein
LDESPAKARGFFVTAQVFAASQNRHIRQFDDGRYRLISLQQGYLSDIETGRRSGAPATLERLAKALEVPAAWLV